MSPELEAFKAYTMEWFKCAKDTRGLRIEIFPEIFERLVAIEDKLDQLLAKKK